MAFMFTRILSMKIKFFTVLAVVGVAAACLSGCGGGEATEDTVTTQDLLFPDVGGEDTGSGDVTADTREDVTTDEGQPDVTDEGAVDVAVDEGFVDNGTDIAPDDVIEEPEVVEYYYECNSLNDCQPWEVCDLALGVCQTRSSNKVNTGGEEIFGFTPPEGGYGDFVVIDGARFITGTQNSERADIGGALVAGTATAHSTISPHRIIGPVPTKGGRVGVVFSGTAGYKRTTTEFVYNSNLTVLSCDDHATPPATGINGGLGEVGPYGAGYVDFVNDDIRVYYPAQCGSVRRPGVPGTYPVVVIVPESQDVNFPFINFEYIGQMLASWGIVTVSMKAEESTDGSTTVTAQAKLISKVPGFLNIDLGTLHDALDGVVTTNSLAWIVFGTGALTMNALLDDDAGSSLKNLAVATIAIAPGGAKLNNNGSASFMTLFAPNDSIANNSFADDSYDEFDSPKWKVEIAGGNHSLFTDHQMYYGGGYVPIVDGEPEIMRKDQMYLTISMILPFLQRAFGLAEPFADQINSGFSTDRITVNKG